MKLKLIILTLCLMGMGLSHSPKVEAQPTSSTQPTNTENSQSLSWQMFSSTPGKYVVDLPGTPTKDTGTSTLLERELSWQLNGVTVPAVNEADLFEYYLVAYSDIPRRLRYDHSQKELLDSVVTSVVNDIQDEQLKTTLKIEEIAFQGLPSRLLTGQGFGQYFVAILSITGDRVYLLLAIDDDSDNFEHFYNSFSLIP
jgi:hypothetical protein